jgi:hypothetical protein
VLQNYGNIECRDAVLAWDAIELERDENGKPRTRWDGETYKRSPVTGEDVPDENARVAIERYVNPRKAEWPKADLIVGNPPFVGNWRMRSAFGAGYVESLRRTYPEVPETADYVMYWWDRAACEVTAGRAARFGFITTNSITQAFARKVVSRHLATGAGRLLFAIPDHPWVDAANGASVRVAMTVLGSGASAGLLRTVVGERGGTEDLSEVSFVDRVGTIHPDLTIGANVSGALGLRANSNVSSPGAKLHGAGFIVSQAEAVELGLDATPGMRARVRRYLNGRDLTGTSRNVRVIDLFGLEEATLRAEWPTLYQWVWARVKPERDVNAREIRRRLWWLFGEPVPRWRRMSAELSRFISTVETAKHRVFIFLEADILPDNMLVNVASDDALLLGVLSSRTHVTWALAAGGHLGVGNDPRYNKTRCFDPFPFPAATPAQQATIRALGESLDAHRKRQQALHPDLTITGMYNVLEKLRAGTELTAKERVIHEHGLVSILKQLHDELDAAVFDAYGWPHDLTDEQILERLVALNAERAEEERNGLVRWLRPEFQNPGGQAAAAQVAIAAANEDESEEATAAAVAAPAKAATWPKKLPERIAAVRDLVAGSRGAWTLAQAVAAFGGAKKGDVATVLESLSALGIVVAYEAAGETRYRAAGRVAA